MICYRDRTYCYRVCDNTGCDRNVTDEVRAQAAAHGLPLAMGDMMTEECGYLPVEADGDCLHLATVDETATRYCQFCGKHMPSECYPNDRREADGGGKGE